MRRGLPALLLATSAFACIQWLRWPEPPGLDQSLFVFYGTWLRRGLVLYRDLWDSKPPGLFGIYALAEPLAGVVHAPRFLDALAAVASGWLAYAVLKHEASGAGARDRAEPFAAAGPCAGALLAAFIGCAPLYGEPGVSAQAEVLMAPLLLGAVLASRRSGARAAFLAGLLLGAAACLKIVALAFLPLPWLFAPARERRSAARASRVVAGWAIPVAICAGWLALDGALAEAARAALLFPRVYAAEIASRTPFLPALPAGALWLARGIPLAVVLAAMGALAAPRRPFAVPALAWLGLAMTAAASQRVIVDYHFFLCTTPLALLAGRGAGWAAAWGASRWRGARAGSPRDTTALAALAAALLLPAAVEMRAWKEHYAPHLAYRRSRIDRGEFLLRLGPMHALWPEAEQIARAVDTARRAAAAPRREESLLVWGLAPAVYALAGCRPATRYGFHQTLLVTGSPLARRWPGVEERRHELLARMRDDPPRFAVVVHGDRSGFEPRESAEELRDFPELAAILAAEYRRSAATRAYELLERPASPP